MAIGPPPTTESPRRWLGALITARIPAVQLREKDRGDSERLDLAMEFFAERSARKTPGLPLLPRLLVNGRVDIAIAGGADGVHLPATGLPIPPMRKSFPHLIYGRSTHTLSEVEAAAEEGADYVTFGPVFDTPSKRAYGAPVGLGALAEASRLGIPVLALGGIMTSDLFPILADHGAAGAAAVRLFEPGADLDQVRSAAEEAFGT